MFAIISDIHGNLEALQTVLADIQSAGIQDVVCLGDVIGYGPNPRECLKVVQERCRFTLLGNHEQAVLGEPIGFNPKAMQAVLWTREQLKDPRFPAAENDALWQFIGTFPTHKEEGERLFVHASPLDPTTQYILPIDAMNAELMAEVFAKVNHYAFGGHTHVPGIFTDQHRFISLSETDYRYELGAGKVLVNVGSVGQPRDGDNRACYVTLDGNELEFRRLEYDFEATRAKIYNSGLPRILGDRLTRGQ